MPEHRATTPSWDQLNAADTAKTADITFALINRLQDLHGQSAAEMCVSTACLLLLTAAAKGIEVRDLLNIANNLMHDAAGRYTPEFKAARMYIEKEI